MQKSIAESYKVKVNLIAERESMMTNKELNNDLYFPKFLVLRRPMLSSSYSQLEWQGFIKDIKLTLKQ